MSQPDEYRAAVQRNIDAAPDLTDEQKDGLAFFRGSADHYVIDDELPVSQMRNDSTSRDLGRSA